MPEVFTIREEDDKAKQIENYFKNCIRFGIIALVVACVCSPLALSIFFLPRTARVITFAIGYAGLFISIVFAGSSRRATSRIIAEKDLHLSDDQKMAIKKSTLLYKAAIAVVFATFFASIVVGIILLYVSR